MMMRARVVTIVVLAGNVRLTVCSNQTCPWCGSCRNAAAFPSANPAAHTSRHQGHVTALAAITLRCASHATKLGRRKTTESTPLERERLQVIETAFRF